MRHRSVMVALLAAAAVVTAGCGSGGGSKNKTSGAQQLTGLFKLAPIYTTFLASSFRSVRFGVHEAHGKGMAMQFNYYLDRGAFHANSDGTFTVDIPKMKAAVRSLAHDLLTIEKEDDTGQKRDKQPVQAFIDDKWKRHRLRRGLIEGPKSKEKHESDAHEMPPGTQHSQAPQHGDQQNPAGGRQSQAAAAFVGIVDRHGDETAALERLQIGGQCCAVHRQEGRNFSDARRLGAVERHHQRELAIGEPERPKCRVKAPRHRPRRALKVQTKTGVANPERGFERYLVQG